MSNVAPAEPKTVWWFSPGHNSSLHSPFLFPHVLVVGNILASIHLVEILKIMSLPPKKTTTTRLMFPLCRHTLTDHEDAIHASSIESNVLQSFTQYQISDLHCSGPSVHYLILHHCGQQWRLSREPAKEEEPVLHCRLYSYSQLKNGLLFQSWYCGRPSASTEALAKEEKPNGVSSSRLCVWN